MYVVDTPCKHGFTPFDQTNNNECITKILDSARKRARVCVLLDRFKQVFGEDACTGGNTKEHFQSRFRSHGIGKLMLNPIRYTKRHINYWVDEDEAAPRMVPTEDADGYNELVRELYERTATGILTGGQYSTPVDSTKLSQNPLDACNIVYILYHRGLIIEEKGFISNKLWLLWLDIDNPSKPLLCMNTNTQMRKC